MTIYRKIRWQNSSFILIVTVLASLCVGCSRSENSNTTPSSQKSIDSIDNLTRLANSGDVNAQVKLAKFFDTGKGVAKNTSTAFDWYLKAAQSGNVVAMLEVAQHYSEGNGVIFDYDNAKQWWKKAADSGNSEAVYKYAMTNALIWRGKSSIMGSNDEIKSIAVRYIAFLTKAANQDYLPATYTLGMVYLLGAKQFSNNHSGYLIDPNLSSALPLLRKAADGGYWEAQWAMAVLYQSGYKTIQANKEYSKRYWNAMEKQTDPNVEASIGELYSWNDQKTYQLGKNKYDDRLLNYYETNQVAAKWFQKAADKDNSDALYDLGLMYLNGQGVFKDTANAIECLKRAANLGNYRAMQQLAYAYIEGNGVVRDYSEAYKWLLKAANENNTTPYSDVHKIRNAIGVLYENGWGVPKNLVLAYAWYNISASGGYEKAKQNLARVESKLNKEQIDRAQLLSRAWKPGMLLTYSQEQSANDSNPASSVPVENSVSPKLADSGTGFYISSDGYILTNHHVVDGCKEIRIPVENGIANIKVEDKVNDLALLKLDVSGKRALNLPNSDELHQGENVLVFGFPLVGFLPNSGNITLGVVSALAGPENNSSLIQITAPVQPGNSGGPVLDNKGRVIGVVVGKANAINIAKLTGDIPQNINFAISLGTIKSFLDGNHIPYSEEGSLFTFSKDNVEIANIARNSSVKIECWR